MTRELIDQITNMMENIRVKKPLIHHITNYVTVNDCANIVLAIGHRQLWRMTSMKWKPSRPFPRRW